MAVRRRMGGGRWAGRLGGCRRRAVHASAVRCSLPVVGCVAGPGSTVRRGGVEAEASRAINPEDLV
ncbi:hypothetical protein ACP70R_032776 [Stipagrostis hirtigluma subsp. patula]